MKENTNTSTIEKTFAVSPTTNDFKNALLIASVLVNLLIVATWLVIAISPSYAVGIVSLG